MTGRRLTVLRKDGVEVAVLDQDAAGRTTVVRATTRVRPDLERWLTRGLAEFEGPFGEKRPRKTGPTDRALLDRIAGRLAGYGFRPFFEPLSLPWWEVMPVAIPFRTAAAHSRRTIDVDSRLKTLPSPRPFAVPTWTSDIVVSRPC